MEASGWGWGAILQKIQIAILQENWGDRQRTLKIGLFMICIVAGIVPLLHHQNVYI
jgi:hypothetical protein